MSLPPCPAPTARVSADGTPYLCRSLTFTLANEAETAALAAVVARFAVAGDLIRLEGDLGAGKSTFARYFLQDLGYAGEVPSPTYTLVQLYATRRVNVAHVDCYRLNSPDELDGLGLDVYRMHGIILSEWSDKGGALLAANQPDFLSYHINNPDNGGVLQVALMPGDSADSRVVTLAASPSWQRRFGLMFDAVRRPVSEARRKAFMDTLGLGAYTLEALPGDWSGRSYARVFLASGETRMLMDSPPPWETTDDFKNVASYYRSIGLRGPKIFAQDRAEGYLLCEDFGTMRLLDFLEKGGKFGPWYTVAAEALITMVQAVPMPSARRYVPRDWWVETARFIDWAFPLAEGRAATFAEREAFMQLWAPLYPLMMEGPTGTMPWDFQATNMMLLGDMPKLKNFGLIDIQDARTAPMAQDLAILLRDIRRGQDDALEQVILDGVADRLDTNREHLQRDVDIASLHHCVRIIGGLARSWLRDGKSAGAERFLARTWDVARQSYGRAEVADIVAFMAPLEEKMLAHLNGKARA